MPKVWLPLFSATAAILIGGCTGTAGSGESERKSEPLAPSANGPLALPLPSSLEPDVRQEPEALAGRSASYWAPDLRQYGDYYSELLPHQNASKPAGDSIAHFVPSWFPGEPEITGLSYVMYDFALPGYAGTDTRLHLTWRSPAPAPGTAYVGLANWDRDSWDWYAANTAQIALPSFAPYITDFTGRLMACVMVTGDMAVALEEVRIGSEPPEVDLIAEGSFALAPAEVRFTAQATDPDGTVVEYRWDASEVGDFELSTGSDPNLTQIYTEPGEHYMYVRAYDDAGVYSRSWDKVNVREPVTFSFGTAQGAEGLNAAMIDDQGEIAYYGYRNVGGNLAAMAMDAEPGVGNYTVLWDGPGTDQLLGAYGDGGDDYAVGSTDSYGSGQSDGLIQAWNSDGFGFELEGSWAIGGANAENLKDVATDGQLVFACGESYDAALNRTFGLLLAFDASTQSLLWAHTLIAPGNCTLEALLYNGLVHVCGSYNPVAGDLAALYASFDPAGNLISAHLLNDVATDEGAETIHHDSAQGIYIGGTVDGGGPRRAFVAAFDGEAYNVTLSDTAQVWGVSLLQTATAPLTFVMYRRATVSDSSVVIAELSYELGIQGDHTELSAIPLGGDSVPARAMRYGLNGLLITGYHTGPKPEKVNPPSLGVGTNAMDWQLIVPALGTPSLTVTATPVATTLISDPTGYDRNAADGDALVHLELHPPDDVG